MAFTYDDYCGSVRAQGKTPVSEEVFNAKKEEFRENAENARYISETFKTNAEMYSSSESVGGKILKGVNSFLAGLAKAMAKEMDRYGN